MTGVRGPAAAGVGKTPRAEQARLVVPFEDNRHLNRLLGEYDGHLALLEERLGIEAHAHGNVVTLTGPAEACEIGARGAREALRARPPGRGYRRRRYRRPAAPRHVGSARQGRARPNPHAPQGDHRPLAQPEQLHQGLGPGRSRVRPRSRRHRQDLSRRRLRRAVPGARTGRAHRPFPACRRGRRAAGLPAGRHAREGRSLSAPALRRPVRRAATGQGGARSGDRRHRDCTARLHARAHPGAFVRHSRRGAEHFSPCR